MKAYINGKFDFLLELWSGEPATKGIPLHSQCVTGDLADLAEECFMRGILSECLPLEYSSLHVEAKPIWSSQPFVQELEVTVTVETSHGPRSCTQRFGAGRWVRTAEAIRQLLIRQGTLTENATVYRALIGLPRGQASVAETPPLEPPPIVTQSLEDSGIRKLENGTLDPQRPVLINSRMIADIVERTEQSETNEAGGAVLGKIIRLAEPLPGTTTRIVTILAVGLADDRHVGGPATFHFSPEALAQAAQIAGVRGQGEAVLTAWHSHGWSDKCINCHKETCPLPSARQVSPEDYQVLESLFSSKATLMPIAGRQVGVPLQRPTVVVHHWRGGFMQPLNWREYEE
ncbi:MAG: Mov34/MPN/PAD-1 family protein [Thermoguttaceae bacterium]|jgi:hypothetical protein